VERPPRGRPILRLLGHGRLLAERGDLAGAELLVAVAVWTD
jgi:hypothetical protein